MAGLTVTTIRAARHPGSATVNGKQRPIRIGDGGGLYLQVAPTGAKTWLFRYMLGGKAREMGLGSVALAREDEQAGAVSLADAREAARGAKALLRRGVDPIEARRAEAKAKAAEVAPHTFRSTMDAYMQAHSAGWRSERFKRQWKAMVEAYAGPILGEMAIGAIDTDAILRVLRQPIGGGTKPRPLWEAMPETAGRVRGRVEAILSYAAAHGWRSIENPARWKGHLSNLLPARAKVAAVVHHHALPWREMGSFMAELRTRESTAARVLELLILTAARSGEVFGMRWGEVDLEHALWTIPASRMKGGRAHRVPLSAAAMAVLRGMQPEERPDPSSLVFPGAARGKPLSGMAMLMLLRRMNPHSEEKPARWRDRATGEPITVHGFRSCFRDWTAEATTYPRELAEAALAHTLGSKVEAAYQRGDMLERRRRMMEAWADYCSVTAPVSGEVIPLRA